MQGPDGFGTVNVKPSNLKATARPAAILFLWRSLPLTPSPYTAVREAAQVVRASGGTGPLPVTVLSGFLGAGKILGERGGKRATRSRGSTARVRRRDAMPHANRL